MDLFSLPEKNKRTSIGQSSIVYRKAGTLLTKASGFMNGFDFTLNPYGGCTFGCTYCYAAFFARSGELRDNWGYWVQVKENALDLLVKKRKKPLTDKTIYMSSVTDPYQPVEKDAEITRSILEELLRYHNPRLVIQTRSPLVTRDIDLLSQFEHVQVNMTVTTDDETVRKVFEPLCPSNGARLNAIRKVHESGINSCVTMTPLLPVADPHQLSRSLLETGINSFVVQPFHASKGKFVAGTREQAMSLIQEMNWGTARYNETLEIIKSYIPQLREGKEGFIPIWQQATSQPGSKPSEIL